MKLASEDKRDRANPLRTVVNRKERKEIEDRAKAAGMTVSAYLRAAGIGTPIRSVLDLKAVGQLAQVNADQARLVAILRTTAIADPDGVRELLLDIRRLQDRVSDIAKAIKT